MKKTTPLQRWALVAVVFGALTVVSGARALFGPPEAQAAVGNAIPLVLWFNFCAGFAYVAVGVGLWRGAHWGAPGSALLAALTLAVTGALATLIATGTPYEMRTVAAMLLRSAFWILVAWLALRARRLAAT